MENKKHCVDCRYCREIKFRLNSGWLGDSCCTYKPETKPEGNYFESYVLVVDAHVDICENFAPGNDK